jgi:NADH:ubiquinone oxidoreductase subunit H
MKWYNMNLLDWWLTFYNKFFGLMLYNYGFFDLVHSLGQYFENLTSIIMPSVLLKYVPLSALSMAFKFIILIALLVFIRGGIPRYRYDFLTKIGWIKFLSLVLAVFLSSLLLCYLT